MNESTVYTKGNIFYFYSFSPAEIIFKVIIKWDWFLFCLVSSENCIIPYSKVSNNSYLLKPPPNPITTSAAKNSTPLLHSLFSILWTHSLFHTSISAWTNLIVTPKSCFLITPILNFRPLINFPNHAPLVGYAISVNLLPYLAYIVSPMTIIPAQYIFYHAISTFLMEPHWTYYACINFINNILNFVQAIPILN